MMKRRTAICKYLDCSFRVIGCSFRITVLMLRYSFQDAGMSGSFRSRGGLSVGRELLPPGQIVLL